MDVFLVRLKLRLPRFINWLHKLVHKLVHNWPVSKFDFYQHKCAKFQAPTCKQDRNWIKKQAVINLSGHFIHSYFELRWTEISYGRVHFHLTFTSWIQSVAPLGRVKKPSKITGRRSIGDFSILRRSAKCTRRPNLKAVPKLARCKLVRHQTVETARFGFEGCARCTILAELDFQRLNCRRDGSSVAWWKLNRHKNFRNVLS